MEIRFRPWTVPNFAVIVQPSGKRQDGFTPFPTLPIREIDAADLSRLCDEFRAEVFRKAGKQDPKGGG